MDVGELGHSSKGLGVQGHEVIIRKIQIQKVFHPLEGTTFNFMDFAGLQVKRNKLAAAWEAVGWKVVEVIIVEVQQLRLGREASWDSSMAPTLTCGMLGLSLEKISFECETCKTSQWK